MVGAAATHTGRGSGLYSALCIGQGVQANGIGGLRLEQPPVGHLLFGIRFCGFDRLFVRWPPGRSVPSPKTHGAFPYTYRSRRNMDVYLSRLRLAQMVIWILGVHHHFSFLGAHDQGHQDLGR